MKERKSEHLDYRIFTRVDKEKHGELLGLLNGSRCRSMSELVRHILYHQKIITQTYDASLDKVMEQLSGIRKELHAIGININQITRQFHQADLPEDKLIQALEIAKLYRQTGLKVSELFIAISQLSEKWLPE